jgi:membrane protease YdiL (CAAX protease family)
MSLEYLFINNILMKKLNEIPLFLIFLVLYTSIFFAMICFLGNHPFYINGYIWSPAFAVFTVYAIKKKKIMELFWKWGDHRIQLQALVIPFLYGLTAYAIIWGIGFAAFDWEKFAGLKSKLGLTGFSDFIVIIFYLVLGGLIGTLSNMSNALGEEIGWRGFLTQKLLVRYSFLSTSCMIGILWSVWHFPLLIKNHDNNGIVPLWYEMGCFVLLIISVSIILTWFTIKTGSVWTATILHASHNLFVLNIFNGNTVNKDHTLYAGKTGIILAVIICFFALYFIVRYFKEDNKRLSNIVN